MSALWRAILPGRRRARLPSLRLGTTHVFRNVAFTSSSFRLDPDLYFFARVYVPASFVGLGCLRAARVAGSVRMGVVNRVAEIAPWSL